MHRRALRGMKSAYVPHDDRPRTAEPGSMHEGSAVVRGPFEQQGQACVYRVNNGR